VSIRLISAVSLLAVGLLGCGADSPDPVEPAHSISDPWQAEPFPVDSTLVAALDRACSASIEQHGLPLAVVDVRGGSRGMLLYAGPKDQADCLAQIQPDGTMGVDGGGGSSSSDPVVRPAGGNVQLLSYGSSGSGVDQTSNVIGFAGPAVARVVITTKAGRQLRASIGPTGWFAAWWPSGDELLHATGYDATGAQTGTAQ